LTTSQQEQLTIELDELQKKFAGNVHSVSRVINPLLSAWSLAHEIDPEVARPLEALLTSLSHRVLTTEGELASAIDEVRLRLARLEPMTSEVGG
jgi:hypothetical protein